VSLPPCPARLHRLTLQMAFNRALFFGAMIPAQAMNRGKEAWNEHARGTLPTLSGHWNNGNIRYSGRRRAVDQLFLRSLLRKCTAKRRSSANRRYADCDFIRQLGRKFRNTNNRSRTRQSCQIPQSDCRNRPSLPGFEDFADSTVGAPSAGRQWKQWIRVL
jgi:hypothetical protein